jgi:DNA-binding transcriptional regulator YiaG
MTMMPSSGQSDRKFTNLAHKLKGQSALAPAPCLAHWTITQRSIHVVLANKAPILKYGNSLPAAVKTPGDLLVACRKEVGLTQEKLAEMTGIHRQWLGRWERGRALPSPVEWSKLAIVLRLPINPEAA